MVVSALPKRAVGYMRVSTAEQAGERHSSLQAQEERILHYCQANSLTFISGFTDILSGRKDNRAEYQRMVDFVMRGGADAIVVQFLDRFGRNPQEILSRIWELKQHGIDVLTTDEDIKDEVVLLVQAGLAGAESRRTSERVRAYMGQSAAKGVHFGRAPYGYRSTKINDQVFWEQHPEEAPVVREMFRLAVEENLGFKAIADRLNAAGYHTRTGVPWAGYTLQHLLTNEALAGVLVYGKQPKKGNPERELVRVPGFFPALLTEQEWEQLQQRMAIRRGTPRGRTHTSQYLLSGILRCGHCGGPMVGRTGSLRKHKNALPGERYRNYWCSRAMNARAACAYYNGHSARRLEAAVLDYLAPYSDPATVKELLSAGEQKEVRRREGARRRAERRLAELESDFNKNLDLLKRGILNEDEFVKANGTRREEVSRLEAEKAELGAWLGEQRERSETVETLPQRVGSFLEDVQSLDVRRAKALLQTILKAAHVYRNGQIELEFNT